MNDNDDDDAAQQQAWQAADEGEQQRLFAEIMARIRAGESTAQDECDLRALLRR